MRPITRAPRIQKHVLRGFLVASVLLSSSSPGFSREKYETLEAQAFGTGTQMGANIGVTLNIYEFSTPADRVTLVQAFEKGQNRSESTRLNSSHVSISYAVFCLKKKINQYQSELIYS